MGVSNVRSVLGLIGSDFSYKDNIQVGDLLQTFPDNKPESEAGFPVGLSLALGGEPLTQFTTFEQNGVNAVTLTQFEVVNVIQDASDGFGAVFLKSKIRGLDGKFDYIVAFRGTDGSNRQDWFANLDLASRLWDVHSAQVVSYLTNLQATGDIPRLNRIHFTGQSLGGGLAQYAAYDFARAVATINPGFRADMTLTTYNGFGGVRGLQLLAEADPGRGAYDPRLLRGVATAHYSIDNDLVHRLGKGTGNVADVGGSWHVNGAGNTYRFPFRRFDDRGVPVPGPNNYQNLVDGHRIESGFYAGFQRNAGFFNFTRALPETIDYIDTEQSRSLGAAFSRIGNKGFSTETSATVRLVVGAAAIGVAGNPIEIAKAAAILHDSFIKAGEPLVAVGSTALIATIGIGTRLAARYTFAGKAAGVLIASYLERRSQLSGEQKSLVYTAVNSFLPTGNQIVQPSAQPLSDSSSSEHDARARLAAAALASQVPNDPDAQALLIDASEVALAEMLRQAGATDTALADAILSADPRQALRAAAETALRQQTALSSMDKMVLAGSIAGQIQAVAEAQGATDAAYVARTRLATEAYLANLGKALANANGDFEADYADANSPLLSGTTTTLTDFRAYRDGLLRALDDPRNAGIRTQIAKAIALADIGGQAVSVRQDTGPNQLDGAGADPHAEINVSAEENGRVTLTAQLPFAAGEGGQRIRMKLAGAGVETFDVVRGSDTITLDANGEFEVVVAQGQRQVAFALLQSRDVDVDSTLTLSATLLGSNGSASHAPRTEARIALDAREEPQAPTQLPQTTRDILGDFEPFDSSSEPGIQPIFDDLGNPVLTGTPAPGQRDILNDSAGNDFISVGGGDDWVTAARGGDDIIHAGDGQDLIGGGEGNDVIEGGAGLDMLIGQQGDDRIKGGADHDVIRADIPGGDGKDILEGGTGEDIVYGGGGEDELYGEDKVALVQAIADGQNEAGSAGRGDFLQGMDGADVIVGAAKADFLSGGDGDDVIVAGGGADFIAGDEVYDAGDLLFERVAPSWSVTKTVNGGVTLYRINNLRFVSEGTGDDRIHAGGGNDDVLAGAGDDVVHGEAGEDVLWGGAGGDALLGGDGADRVIGDDVNLAQGNDFLDGGTGDDVLLALGGDDVLYGGGGNDRLEGDFDLAGNDYLDGEDGTDTLIGSGGADQLYGGLGNDQLFGDADDVATSQHGADELFGEEGDDRLQTYAGDDYADGGSGNDLLAGYEGRDTLSGGEGDDDLIGDLATDTESGDADKLEGGAGKDRLFGEGGDDLLVGGAGEDILQGGFGTDRLYGDEDIDILFGQNGDDVLAGGDGNDILIGEDNTGASTGGNDVLEGGAGDDIAAGDAGNDTLAGGAGHDQLIGGAGADRVSGGSGFDIVDGGDGTDRIDGGADGDSLLGGQGADTIEGGDGDDHMQGDAGDDLLAGGAGRDRYAFRFGDGVDTISDSAGNTLQLAFAFFPGMFLLDVGSLVIDFGGGDEIHIEGFDPADPLANPVIDTFEFENATLSLADILAAGFNLVGTPDADVIIGTGFADEIDALESDDTVIANGGDDVVFAGEGDDYVVAGDGHDSVFGEDGHDLVLGEGGEDLIEGGFGNDELRGGEEGDGLLGDEGDDTLEGGDGDDALSGGEGDDSLLGGEGQDSLYGAEGLDVVAGGAGHDTYLVDDALDQVVEDLDAGTDRVEASVDYTLTDNVENLVLEPGSAAVIGTGNDLDNEIYGNEGDNVLAGAGGNDLLDGGGGVDMLDGGAGDDVLVLTAGGAMSGGVLLGGAGIDVLVGADEADVLDGGADRDRMDGNDGDDLYIVDQSDDIVVEQDLWSRDPFTGEAIVGRMGEDTVRSSASFKLTKFVENLVLTGSADIDGAGNAERNVLQGNDGANELVSTQLDGAHDNLVSGAGSVSYGGPLPSGTAERLWDRALARYFEGEITSDDLDSIGLEIDVNAREGDTLEGAGGNDRLIGGWDHDSLIGGEGNDLLLGSGGDDTMEGGAGDDAYVVDGEFSYRFGFGNTATIRYADFGFDQLSEDEDAGADTVYSNVLEWGLGEHFENLVLLDPEARAALGFTEGDGLFAAGAMPLYGYGNELGNSIVGNLFGNELYGSEGNDTLAGMDGDDSLDGGEGSDSMAGGAGDDEYYVDEAGDIVREEAGGGEDYVVSDITYTLTDDVEDLELLGSYDEVLEDYVDALNGTGNALDNEIFGNAGSNVLAGLEGSDFLDGGAGEDVLEGGGGHDELDGGEGADSMTGGEGDDVYHVDDELDLTVEDAAGGGGHDLVRAGLSHTLGDNIEDLTLEDWAGDAQGIGNELANTITGNEDGNALHGLEGDDRIVGHGGDDLLEGGEGNDSLDGGEGQDEILAGDGDDQLAGGAGDDRLEAGAGADQLDGGEGMDTMLGGEGDDVYHVDLFDEVVSEELDEGVDLVRSSESFSLPDNVENLTLLGDWDGEFVSFLNGQGNALANVIIGNDGFNFSLAGREGDDSIDGRAGGDDIFGEDGDDLLYGGDDAVVVIEDGGYGGYGGDGGEGGEPAFKQPSADDGGYGGYGGYGGIEVLASNSDYIEGGNGIDDIDGGSGNDRLFGDDGNDTLYGGNDGLSIDAENGRVDGGEGAESNGRAFLPNDDELFGGSGDDSLDGGSGSDFLSGGDGVDTLLGGADGPLNTDNRDQLDGGLGIDFMAGGSDADSYRVDGTFVIEARDVVNDCGVLVEDVPTRVWTVDTVVEYEDQGIDTITAAAEITLPDHVERLFLVFSPDVAFGAGNALDNEIFGNSNHDRLEGRDGHDRLFGGAGNDTLEGGSGNDTLEGGGGNDTYNLTPGGGHDTVQNFGGGFDTVRVTQQTPASGLTLSTNGIDVFLSIDGGADSLTLQGWFATSSASRVRQVVFCDGTVLNEAAIAAAANANRLFVEDDFALASEDGGPVTGNVLGNDSAAGGLLAVVNPGTYFGSYGMLELGVDGAYTYTPDAQWLSQGEVVEDVIAYRAQDGTHAHDGALLRVTVQGENDAPEFLAGGGDSGAVTEDFAFVSDFENEMLQNGGFEFFSFFGWDVDGNTDFSGVFDGAEGAEAFFGVLDGETLIGQEVFTESSETYAIRFRLRGGASADATFRATWNGETLAAFDNAVFGDFSEFTYLVQGVDDFARLEFAFHNAPDFWYLDDVQLNELVHLEQIPEVQSAEGFVDFIDVDRLDAHSLTFSPQSGDYIGSFDAGFNFDSTFIGFGQVRWTFEVENDALQAMAEGDVLEQRYDLTLEDPYGETTTRTVTVTLHGANDAPVADNDEAFVQEDATLVATGDVLENDFDVDDGDTLSLVTGGTFVGQYGTLVLADDGTYTYTLDGDAVQFLPQGEEVVEAFDYQVIDDALNPLSTIATLTVYVEGLNDAPVAADDAAAVQEDLAERVDGNVLDNDLEIDQASDEWSEGVALEVTNPGEYAGQHGTLFLEADGSYSYRLDGGLAAVQALAQGASLTETFSYDVSDGLESDSAELVITIDGSNDTPQALPDAAAVREDATLTASGNVLGNDEDIDHGTTLTVLEPGQFIGQFGTLVLDADGSYTYTLANERADIQALAEGEQRAEVFWYEASDGLEPSFTAPLVVTIDGANDGPRAAAELAGVQEDGTLSASGNVLGNDSDRDAGAFLEVAGPGVYAGAYGTLTLAADGSYTYDLDNGAAHVQALQQGRRVLDVFTYEASDGSESAGARLTVLVAGANDAPVAADDAATASEDGATVVRGNLLENDVDIDADTLLRVAGPVTYQGLYGTLTIGAGGGYTYRLDNASVAIQSLHEGEELAEAFAYTATDGFASDTGVLTITIVGANDAPDTEDDSAMLREDVTLVAMGNVLANDDDADANTVLTVANEGAYGSLVLNEDGSFTYTLANESEAVQSLAAGQQVTEAFTYLATDGMESTEGTLTVTIAGTNDAPVAQPDTAAASEDGVVVVSGDLLTNDTDVDAGATLAAAEDTVVGAYGTLTIAEDGTYSYALNNASLAVQSLAAGQAVNDVLAYEVSDGIVASGGTFTVTITGANDAPTLDNAIADQNAEAGAPFAFTLAANTFGDIDQNDVLTYTATLANGEDLPAWLAFDAATRTFTGTPPGGGDDCGCGDEGGVDSLDIRVRAADLAGASAFDDFTLAIAGGGGGGGGMTIIGTDGDDTLAGTPCDDIIDGRKGFDVMRGGAGNDTYFVDETCLPRHKGNEGVGNGEDPPPPGHDHNQNDGPGTGPGNPGSQGGSHHHDDDDCDDHGHQGMECKVDQVIENAGAGYDIVYASADYTLPSNVEEVRLLGSADLDATGNSADNVLVGNKGDNRLRGGSGADVYVHQLYGGDDVIEEGGGSPDALLFGEGINADMVRLERRRDDLVVDLAGPHGKVTVKGWFASSSKRVERIQFADGTAWNEQDIRERTRGAGSYGHGDYHGYSHLDRDERAYRSHSAGEKRDDKEPASRKDDFVRDGYSRRWGFDFEETVAALAAGARSLTREEVAAGWRAVARYAHSLGADEAGADGAGLTGAPLAGTGSAPAAMRFGYEGSTAAPRGQDMLRTLEGLMEGFRNL